MIFITALCLALASGKQFMPLLETEDQGVSARNDLTEIEDVALTAPSSLQRLLSSDDTEGEADEDETDENEEDDDEEEDDEAEDDKDGEKGWITPRLGAEVVGGCILLGAGAFVGSWWKGEKSAPETIEYTLTGKDQIDAFLKEAKETLEFTKGASKTGEDEAEHELKVTFDVKQCTAFMTTQFGAQLTKTFGMTLKGAPGPAEETAAEKEAREKAEKAAEEEKKRKAAEAAKKKEKD